jgi:L-lactate utilization protein LutC
VKLRPQDAAGRADLLARIERAEIGLTGADAAIAETGTLFLAHGPGRPLLVSQLPRRHVVMLPASRVHPTLESWLAIEHRPANLTALTGVGRSFDIELHPSVGVHGPRERHVIVVMGM